MGEPPLSGLTVLDFSRILAGPYCTMLLGDLGAEVLKIEPPSGDDCRHWGPPFVGGESAYFLAVNRNKRSLCLDLKREEGRALVQRLLSSTDVLVENFRPGTMDRLGLGYEQLCDRHPRLVYCSISGYGQTGPHRERPGYDAVMQGEGGWMALTGEPEGMPMKVGVSLADIFTGMMASEGILAALFNRERTGRGERIDIALFDSVMATLCYQAQGYLMTGELPKRLGNRHSSLTPYETFPTADGHVIVGVGNDTLWKRFCVAVDCPELDVPELEHNASRVARREELSVRLESLFLSKTTDEWIDLIGRAGIPVGRVRNVAEVFESPQVADRKMRIEVEHSKLGRLPLTGNPIKLGRSGERKHEAPPVLGEDTVNVLRERLGLDDEALKGLRERGVFGPEF
ncbi:MAG TPA: CoA transferase [Vicinamibacteria bacterium]|nr:CoA transferase [Vicinamibacteria bacterium]